MNAVNIRALRGWWDNILGAACVVEDVLTTVRSHRLTQAETRQLMESERMAALAQALQGCTHTPPCPPTSAPDRTAAVEIYADAACIYLCNGLILSTREITAPDSPSGLYIPMPRERTP